MKVLFSLFILINLNLFASDNDGVKIRITEDKLEKTCKVFFGSVESRKVLLSIVNSHGKTVQTDEVEGFGFEKTYSFQKLPKGLYTITLDYEGETYRHDLFIKSKKEVWEESIVVEAKEDAIHIHVEEYNEDPVSVFFLRRDGSWVVYDYWETNANNRDKIYKKEKFEGAYKLEIAQNGEVVLSQSLASF